MPFGLLLDLWECHKQYNGQAVPAHEHYIDDIISDGICPISGSFTSTLVHLCHNFFVIFFYSLDIFKDLEADGKQKLADAGMEFIDIDVDSFRACMDKFYELAGWTDDFKSAVTTAMETYRANK